MEDYQYLLQQIPSRIFIATLIFMAVVYIGAMVGLSFIPASMAKKKGYTFGGFYCLSFFVSFVVTIIIAALITDKNPKPQALYTPYYGVPYPPYGQPYVPPPYGGITPPPQNQPDSSCPPGNPTYYPPHCPNCGEALTNEGCFCPRCGARFR